MGKHLFMPKKLLFIILLASQALANPWDELRFEGLEAGQGYNLSIGSGFFC